MTLTHGPARCTLDLDSGGKRSGFIDLDHSDNDHAFSVIRVPVGVIAGGEGPTVLLTAGNHGDEYEGQVVLHRLMAMLEPAMIAGRVIMLPALNTPAMLARERVSPLDGGNMNRSFPGAADHGPTRAVAGFVSAHLIPRADMILDLHSGGTSARYTDSGFLLRGDNPELDAANLALAEAFGAPFTLVCPMGGPFSGDFDSEATARAHGSCPASSAAWAHSRRLRWREAGPAVCACWSMRA